MSGATRSTLPAPSAVLFSPHNDDETLFAYYQVLRYKPRIVVVLRSVRQETQQGGPSHTTRQAETACAAELAGATYEQWDYPDSDPPWFTISEAVEAYLNEFRPEVVIAPAFELGGHEDHNAVANIVNAAQITYRIPGVIRFYTYRRGHGRTMAGTLVEATEDERERKLWALGCYASQAAHPATAAWFDPHRYGDLREWIT